MSTEQLSEAHHQHELASARCVAAEAIVAQKQTLVEQRQTFLSQVRIVAPFDGAVSARYVDRGRSVDRGTPIVRLVRTEPLKLRFAVPGSMAALVRVGTGVTATIAEPPAVLMGTVDRLSPEVDAVTQNLVVEATLPVSPHGQPTRPVLIGRSATVTLDVDSRRSVPMEQGAAK